MNSGMRGVDFCRSCDSTQMFSVLDLGSQPLANGLIRNPKEVEVQQFPLHMYVCLECGLGQLGEYATPNEIFEDYRYLSSVSSTWNLHAKEFAKSSIKRLGLDSKSFVIEIASNDGYLLRHFQELGMSVLGIEPAKNVAEIARESGVPTISEFMSEEFGKLLKQDQPTPDLIPANNVLAHVPDMKDFLAGISQVMGKSTVLTVENPSMLEMLSNVHFDTIYHEHFSYLTTHSVQIAVNQVGLEIFDVESLATHGGSLRYWICKKGSFPVSTSVQAQIQSEISLGILSEEIYTEFCLRAKNTIAQFKEFLLKTKARNEKVVGYGAAAKSVVLLNAAGATADLIEYVADGGAEKKGYYIPTCDIQIIAPEEIREINPDHVVIFPWNIASEISENIKQLCENSVNIWVAIPEMRLINES
jgi:2-polyprenyl-3-methyl-5-hydroxy-6-metoxy-1,4-benzoquinol methylase